MSCIERLGSVSAWAVDPINMRDHMRPRLVGAGARGAGSCVLTGREHGQTALCDRTALTRV